MALAWWRCGRLGQTKICFILFVMICTQHSTRLLHRKAASIARFNLEAQSIK